MLVDVGVSPAIGVSNPHGAVFLPDGSVRFRLWAPNHRRVQMELSTQSRPLLMDRKEAGFFDVTVENSRRGDLYRFLLPDGKYCPILLRVISRRMSMVRANW